MLVELLLAFGIIVILYILFCDLCDQNKINNDVSENDSDKKENFIGYGYGYRVPYYAGGYYYPYYYSGCNEDVFGNVGCFQPPYLY